MIDYNYDISDDVFKDCAEKNFDTNMKLHGEMLKDAKRQLTKITETLSTIKDLLINTMVKTKDNKHVFRVSERPYVKIVEKHKPDGTVEKELYSYNETEQQWELLGD